MRTLVGFGIALLLTVSVFAQHRTNFSGSQNVITGSATHIVFSGGAPGASGFRSGFALGASSRFSSRNNNNNGTFVYAYPVFVGSFGGGYDSSGYAPEAPAPQQQPNITIVMPPQQSAVAMSPYDGPPRPQMTVVPPDATAQSDESAEPAHFLLAFKDHTIYSAIAYWVDGDTLHYFTAGNTHNQVSVSLIDRAMTQRLNKDAGVEVNLPPAK